MHSRQVSAICSQPCWNGSGSGLNRFQNYLHTWYLHRPTMRLFQRVDHPGGGRTYTHR